MAAVISYAVLNRQSALQAGIEIGKLSSNRSLVWREPETSVGLCPWRDRDADASLSLGETQIQYCGPHYYRNRVLKTPGIKVQTSGTPWVRRKSNMVAGNPRP